ncbi:MAG: zf-HC2 domain-containing protein [Actinomycetota bacterium]|nr:zf-HC2 domain-containing protein [Actinomycetota bacterium]
MRCSEIREVLPAYVHEGGATLAVRRHLATCRDCRAEMKRYEVLTDSLGALALARARVPEDLTRSLYSIPEQAGVVEGVRSHLSRNRATYLGGAAVALAGAGAAVWTLRARRLAAA